MYPKALNCYCVLEAIGAANAHFGTRRMVSMQITSTRVVVGAEAERAVRFIFELNINPLKAADPREGAELSSFSLEVKGHDTNWVLDDVLTSSEGDVVHKLLLKQVLDDPTDRQYVVVSRPSTAIDDAFSSIVRFEGPLDSEASERQHVFQYHC